MVYLRRLQVLAPLVFRGGAEKGDRRNLPERPDGCFAQIAPVPCATDGPAEGRIGGPPLYYRTAGPDAVTLLDFADFNDARGRPESARLARLAVLRPAVV